MKDGTVVLANVKSGETLTEQDKEIIAEWVQFCRDRKAAREAKEQRKRNRKQSC
jgi:hypothetical protein